MEKPRCKSQLFMSAFMSTFLHYSGLVSTGSYNTCLTDEFMQLLKQYGKSCGMFAVDEYTWDWVEFGLALSEDPEFLYGAMITSQGRELLITLNRVGAPLAASTATIINLPSQVTNPFGKELGLFGMKLSK